MAKKKNIFRFSLKLRNCDKKFCEELPPGVLVTQEADFSNFPSHLPKSMLAASLIEQEEKFLDEFIEVVVEPVE